ncbi:DUF2459 domain-containing protein [Aequorivita lipolytica]|uniref:DUF2459 domain-containing protein n=1 Tax=Aequorivita lipolytica TaxID=153267 RepID=UPI000DBC0A05|nr:DUF2459 domain-containing protein [Aequorivita lipolytica]SRX50840.1 hypothetical protein AEQU2_01318 [Aequorivita lipolytica]
MIKKITKWVLCFLSIPVIYILISLLLTAVTVNKKNQNNESSRSIFLTTNGVHLAIVLPKNNIDSLVLSGIKHSTTENYLAFGWGDENFYLNTPTWGDLTFKNAFGAMFLKSPTLIHLTRYQNKQTGWIEIKVTESELKKLNSYLFETFFLNKNGEKVMLLGEGYTSRDDFYKANGSYSFFNTCNSWVNSAFKNAGLKSCYWTPFDFGLMNKYK